MQVDSQPPVLGRGVAAGTTGEKWLLGPSRWWGGGTGFAEIEESGGR